MNIYSPKQGDAILEFFSDFKEWCHNNPLTSEDVESKKLPAPPWIPILFGKDNGFYGKKHTPEQIKAWSDMRLGDKNPNYGGKAWTEETLRKLRQPKKNKENYKGTPGKICGVDKCGRNIQISADLYNKQKESGLPMSEWEFVSPVSKEAKNRRHK